MPRAIILIFILLLIVVGAMFFLSGRVEEQQTSPVEVEVNLPADAR